MTLTKAITRSSLTLLAMATLLAWIGCKARQPGSFETATMSRIKRSVTIGGSKVANPLPDDEATIRAGKDNFSHYCMVCHGLDGQNTGVPFADKMSPPVPSLGSRAVQAYSDGQLKWIVENGIFPSGMPASKDILNEDEIWEIVHYLRHLPVKGSLGEPSVFSGESSREEGVPKPMRAE